MPPVVGLRVVNCEVPRLRLVIPLLVPLLDVAGSTIPARLKGGGGAGGGGGGGAGIELLKHMTTLSLGYFVFYFGTCKLFLSVGTHVSRLLSSIFLGLNLGGQDTFRETFGLCMQAVARLLMVRSSFPHVCTE